MTGQIKPIVSKTKIFDKLEMRLGQIIELELETETARPTYRMLIDFGEFGKKVSYGRFTHNSIEELIGKLVVGILNFNPIQMDVGMSEVMVISVQYPKTESGEATILTPLVDAKIGGKVF